MGNVKHRGNGQGTVIRRGKTFTAIVTVGRYTENGKTKYIRKSKGGFRTRSAALAFLPVLAGKMERAPKWMQDASLEWAFRLYKQPSRFMRMMALPKFALKVMFSSSK